MQLPKNKEELQWWIEDNRSKFFMLCGLAVVAVVVVVFIIYSSLPKKEPIIEAPEEEKHEEIIIGGVDIEKEQEKIENSVEEKQREDYGLLCNIRPETYQYPFSYMEQYDYGFVTVRMEESGEEFSLYVEPGTFSGEPLTNETLRNMAREAGNFYLRGNFEPIDEEIVASWKLRDKRNVIDLFKDPKFNKTTAKAWDKNMALCKESRGYSKKDTEETIAKEDWDSIMEEMYLYFEQYLVEMENSPFTAYREENPLPVYENIKVCKEGKPVYICNNDKDGWRVLSNSNMNDYIYAYWSAYFSKAKEMFINEDDCIAASSLNPGQFYKLLKRENFYFENDKREEMVLWWKTSDMKEHTFYYPSQNSWLANETLSPSQGESFYRFKMDEDVVVFAYYYPEESYSLKIDSSVDVDLVKEDGSIELEKMNFKISETIKFKREHFIEDTTPVKISSFIFDQEEYTMPDGKVFLLNDTKYGIELVGNSGSRASIQPGEEFYIDEAIGTFTWKIQN